MSWLASRLGLEVFCLLGADGDVPLSGHGRELASAVGALYAVVRDTFDDAAGLG